MSNTELLAILIDVDAILFGKSVFYILVNQEKIFSLVKLRPHFWCKRGDGFIFYILTQRLTSGPVDLSETSELINRLFLFIYPN